MCRWYLLLFNLVILQLVTATPEIARAGGQHLLQRADKCGLDCVSFFGWGYTPLEVATKRGFVEVARELLDRGAEISGRTIVLACYYGQLEITQLLLERKPSLMHQKDKYGRTPLHWAVANG
jgi:ankyrin repeat protein